jgi:MFS family permease
MPNKKLILPIFLIVAVDILGLTIVIPFLPFYVEKFGASPFMVGLVMSSYALFQLLASPILGVLSDRYGRKPILVISQIGTLIGFIILARAQALWMVFLSRMIDGATAGNITVAQAYLADITEPQHRTKSFAVIGISFGLGFLIGPGISGILAHYGEIYPLYAAIALSALSILATIVLLPWSAPVAQTKSTDPSEQFSKLSIFEWGQYRDVFANVEMRKLMIDFIAFISMFSLFFSGFALFAERRFTTVNGMSYGTREIGYLFAYSGFLGLIIQGGLVGRLSKKLGETKLAFYAFISSCLGYAILACSFHLPMLLLATLLGSFGSGVLRPVLMSMISQKAKREEQGKVMGITQSLSSVAQIIAPMISGFLIGRDHLAGWALTLSLFAAIGIALTRSKSTQKKPVRACH